MAKGKLEFNTFVKGIITEAGPLTFPDGASLDEANFVLNRDGSRQRRFGIDYEEEAVLHDLDSIGTGVVATHRWENPDNAGDFEILVVQDGEWLSFFNANSDAITADELNNGNRIDTGFNSDIVISTASINGKMFITGGSKKVTELSFDRDTELVTSRSFHLHMRDLWGVDDTLDTEDRPNSLSQEHEYNLRNQGWVESFKCGTSRDLDAGEFTTTDPVTHTFNQQGFYPSNSDVLHVFKATSTTGIGALNSYDSYALETGAEGSAEASKGSVVLKNIWNRGSQRETRTSVNTLTADQSSGVASSVAAYAGRLFYSFKQTALLDPDDRSPNLNTLIAFSQVGTENAHKCYSKNDPSAETFNEPLDTDGGFIVIPEIGEVYDMKPLGDSLFVIASNGVWEIHGGEGSFSSTTQSQSKVSTVGALSRKGLLAAEDAIAYWAKGGIYVVTINEVSLRGVSNNITQATIQGLYDNIPAEAKRSIASVYDSVSRQMRWLYRDTDLIDNSLYNRELVFDLNLSAFEKNEFGDLPDEDNYAYPAGYIDVPDVLITRATQEAVTVEGVAITAGGEIVTARERLVSESVRLSTKFLAAIKEVGVDWKFTAAQLKEIDFVDWPQIDGGIDSPARLLTGYWTGGNSTNDKRMPYLFTHFRRTEQGFEDGGEGGFDPVGESACKLKAQWEWTDTAAAGKFGVEIDAYKLPRLYTPEDISDPMDYGFTVVTTKNKVRGSGNALSLNFTTEPGKDCHIYGWAIEILEEDS